MGQALRKLPAAQYEYRVLCPTCGGPTILVEVLVLHWLNGLKVRRAVVGRYECGSLPPCRHEYPEFLRGLSGKEAGIETVFCELPLRSP